MANTIVSLFDKQTDAQEAMRELQNAGFNRSRIDITENKSANIIDKLDRANVPQEAARFYQEGVKRGGSLLTIDVEDNEIDRAMQILEPYKPVDVNERATQYRESGYTDFDLDHVATRDNNAVIPVVAEELRVGKRAVERGGVRIYTRIIEQPVEETVRLREEHVNVERRPVDRPISDADVSAFREGTIEVTETAEVPVVAKEARVVEEVVVNKEATERTETVRDTVRRTDVDVEQLDTDQQTRARGSNR